MKRELFRIITIKELENSFLVYITIDKQHPIFDGHFPGNPVLPGVCMVQMLTDIINSESKETLVLNEAKIIKFTQTIVPGKVSDLHFEITKSKLDDTVQVKATLNSNRGNHFKFSGTFISAVAV